VPGSTRELTPEERLALDVRGYTIIYDVLSTAELAEANRMDPIKALALARREQLADTPPTGQGPLHKVACDQLRAAVLHARPGHQLSALIIWAKSLL
jgi:hypothetical protein